MRKVNIKKGLIGFNNLNEMIVSSPGHIFHLTNEKHYKHILKAGDKLMGAVLETKFCICSEYTLKDGNTVFGYLIEIPDVLSPIAIQTLKKIDNNHYSDYNSEYELSTIQTLG